MGQPPRGRHPGRARHDGPRRRVGDGERGAALPPSSRHPFGRHGHLRPARHRGVSHRVGAYGEPIGPAVGQRGLRCGRAREVRPAGPRHAGCSPRDARPHRTTPRRAHRPVAAPPGRRRLRHDLRGRHHRGVPDRVTGTDGHAAPPAAPHVLRPGGRGGAHPPRPHPGWVGAPLHPAAQRPGTRHLPPPAPRELPGQDPRGSAVPGAAHADGDRRRRLHPVGGRPAAPGDGLEAFGGTYGTPPAAALRGDGRQRHRGRRRRSALREARRLRQLRLSREPLGELRLHRVLVVLAQVPLPGRVLYRPVALPAHGLLLAALAGAGRPASRGDRSQSRRRRVELAGRSRAVRRIHRWVRRPARPQLRPPHRR